ncbi:glycerophosphodiester phosphodiesterase [candidate division KSB1 bacterium]|nr:MAG: glycerophosphodiester phosphodiesterase [candidate division KSB1 bacterium]
MTMRNFDDDHLNIAHRGASGHAPENTLTAFAKAVELGADGIEFDVQLTKDGTPIVLHDYTLERTTSGAGFVLDRRLDEIAELDAGSWYAPPFAGVAIPTLEQVLEYGKGKLLLNIELKKSPQPVELVERVCAKIMAHDVLDQCLITSFDAKAVALVSQILPECRTGLLVNKMVEAMWEGGWSFLAIKHELISIEVVERAEAARKKIIAWTVNEEAEIDKLLDLRVGRIITNYPDRLFTRLTQRRRDAEEKQKC